MMTLINLKDKKSAHIIEGSKVVYYVDLFLCRYVESPPPGSPHF